ncbi:hypothetical protein RDABS01_003322 [Bienertia sinuspersici]
MSTYVLYNQTQPYYSIISHLTSPTLCRFRVTSNYPYTMADPRCYKLVCDRKVEEIQVTSSAYFTVPSCTFQCETLVNIVLKISMGCFFPPLTTFNLQKLKLLCFSHGGRYDNIAMLIKSCPLLEVLDMSLNCPLDSPCISIIAPNLKSLSFKMRNAIHQHQVIIGAPKLTYLYAISGGSVIDFVMDPIVLDIANIDLTYLSFLSMREGMDSNEFIRQICKFVAWLSSVRELHLESNIKLSAYMHSVGSMPLFGNLSYGRMTLTRSSGVNDFLLFLQISPNLEEVFVTFSYEEGNPLADMTQTAVIVPRLLFNNLDYVNITGVQGNNDEVDLVSYILRNVIGLNHLYILVDVDNVVEDEDARVGKEFKLYKDCFRLPITSLMARVVFSG